MDIGTLTGAVSIDDQFSDALTLAAEKVKSFADDFDGAMGAIALSAGIAVGAITAVTAAVTALGVEGSKIIGVETAFDHLAESAGTTGDTLRSNLSEGVRGTVTEMQLMESTSRLLGSGMKLTADQALLMGTASRELGKATGGDATTGLNMMSMALTTGQPRLLQRQIGLIDIKKGELDYANSIGLTVPQLDAAGQLEGKRIAILGAVQSWLDRVGTSETSFAERILQTSVAIKSWFEDLSKMVAKSDDVNTALVTITTALDKAFGGRSFAEVALDGINAFARGVTAAVPYVESFGRAVKSVYDFLDSNSAIIVSATKTVAEFGAAWLIFSAGSSVVTGVTAGLESIAAKATLASGAMAALDFTTFANAGTSISLLAGAVTAALGPIGLIATAIGAAALAWSNWAQSSADAALKAETAGAKADALAASKAREAKATTDATAATTADNAASVAAKIIKEAHDKAVQALTGSIQKANSEINLSTDAFNATNSAMRLTIESQNILIPLLDKIIESGRQLTSAEKDYYLATTVSRENLVHQGEALLSLHNIRLSDIQSAQAAGATEKDLAAKYGVTVESLKAYQTELTQTRDLRRQLADLDAKLTESSADQAITQHNREFQDAVDKLDKTSTAYMTNYDLLTQIRDKANQEEKLDIATIQSARTSSLQDVADKTLQTYDYMITHSHEFTRQALEEELQKVRETSAAATEMGQAYAAGFTTAADAAQRLQDKMDALKKKEEEAAAAAKKLFDMGNSVTYDLTTVSGVERYRQANPGNTINLSDDQITRLAKAGATLNDLFTFGAIAYTDAAKAGGAAVLNMTALNDILTRGGQAAATTATSLGAVTSALDAVTNAAARTAGVPPPSGGGSGGHTQRADTGVLFDQLNAQQAALYTAGDFAGAQAITDQITAQGLWPPGYSSSPAVPVSSSGGSSGGFVPNKTDNSIPSQPTTINLMLPDGRVLASVVSSELFGNLGLRVS